MGLRITDLPKDEMDADFAVSMFEAAAERLHVIDATHAYCTKACIWVESCATTFSCRMTDLRCVHSLRTVC